MQDSPISWIVKPTKRKSRVHYGFHAYFTTQPFNVVQEYIKHYSREGDLVVDPFCGSGVTPTEAIRLNRRALGVDLNPFAVFLSRCKCNTINVEKTVKMFDGIIDRIGTKCGEVERLPEEKLHRLKIDNWYPDNVELPSDSDRKFLHEIFTKKQLYQHALIHSEIVKIRKSNERDILFLSFLATLTRANIAYSLPNDGRSVNSGDFTIFHTGRYRVPKKVVEIEVLPVFKRRFADIIAAKKETNQVFHNNNAAKNVNIIRASATDLTQVLNDDSVDYIYTDPPYGAHIKYIDLSTIYNAWLQELPGEERNIEVIEGGELKQTRSRYLDLLSESISEMSRVLKKNKWMSLVFQHHDPQIWTSIVESARKAGFDYVNSVAQYTTLPSWHKVDNKDSVLSSQMIVNFIKRKSVVVGVDKSMITLDQLVCNVAEREILKRHGASFEDIMTALVPELFEHNFIHEQAQTKASKLFELLKHEFAYDDATLIFSLPDEKEKRIGGYIKMEERIKYYLTSYMRKVNAATLDQIVPEILPKIINGNSPSGQDILTELEKIAVCNPTTGVWTYQTPAQIGLAFGIELDKPSPAQPPPLTPHNKTIYLLATLATRYGMKPKVGLKEQSEPFLKAVNQVNTLALAGVDDKTVRNINEIDLLWVSPASSKPIYAFEVEESTSITSAFERFVSLSKQDSGIGTERRMVIVVPRRRQKKLSQVFNSSSYIGTPHYMENKVRILYVEDFMKAYPDLYGESDFRKLEGMLTTV